MENIIEYMVKKEKDSADSLKIFGIYAAAFVLTVLSFMFLKSFAIIGAAASIYLAYYFSQNFKLEFEYCIVAKDITIDKIMNRKKRKTIIAIDSTDILAIAQQANSDVLNEYKAVKTIFAAAKKTDDSNYIIVCKTKDGITKVTVSFDERIVSHFKQVLPQKMF